MSIINVPIDALTVVVLTHELAHAYTHLGLDIDSHAWSVSSFAATDIHILEGLAQYYTEAVCYNIAKGYPAALDTFEKLLSEQSMPYQCYKDWIDDGGVAGELILHYLIRTRQHNIRDYDRFLQEFDQGLGLLRTNKQLNKQHRKIRPPEAKQKPAHKFSEDDWNLFDGDEKTNLKTTKE